MILYRKAAQLRVRRAAAPEPPFWAATTIAPYGARRATPVAIEYLALRATGAERLEVTVSDPVRDTLERMPPLSAPVVIDAAESAETVFRRGEEALVFCASRSLAATCLVSTRAGLPAKTGRHSTIAIAAWPLELARLDAMFADATRQGLRWGVIVPVMFPVTTDLAALEALAGLAKQHGAAYLASMSIDLEPTAKQALAQAASLTHDDDRYAMLFHGSVEPVHLATERHIAALASAHGLADHVVSPDGDERTNWNAAVLLTLVASRMIAMELDLDLAGSILRSARAVAELGKPLARIAEAASLSIIGGLDETSAEMLREWLGGAVPSFAEFVNEQWRVRRDNY